MIENMNTTPMANRFTIGIFGRRNAGKSSLINALTGQSIAVTSQVPGTTTDPVYKAMELLPLGPVVFIDTAGFDDTGELGELRIEKTYEVLRKCNFAIVVGEFGRGTDPEALAFVKELTERQIPCIYVLNKCDQAGSRETEIEKIKELAKVPVICVSALKREGIDELKDQIARHNNPDDREPALIGDLMGSGEIAVLVTPIDKAAPKGRLILPQQQTIRDILEIDGIALVTKEHELKQTLDCLKADPAIVITDSQAFLKVSADTPPHVPLTSFSILFARQKSDLAEMVRGIKRIERLQPGEKVLIVEGCTHHRQADDIGKVKIPRWIRQIAGGEISFEWASGAGFPKDIKEYAVIVHCGGCMINRREMQYRVNKALKQGVPVTNYGILIAYVQGILERAIRPFPAASLAYEENWDYND
ncbi:[FeFe] hydrogenase H-cluster maturation GTPase HydF [Sinanaerobacter chloroacetimidivorans]|nr:[FeFe] hydrogenase H-cluster maturation GTPase HydF [Sinanaerobacter chloroacetimidivorans]